MKSRSRAEECQESGCALDVESRKPAENQGRRRRALSLLFRRTLRYAANHCTTDDNMSKRSSTSPSRRS